MAEGRELSLAPTFHKAAARSLLRTSARPNSATTTSDPLRLRRPRWPRRSSSAGHAPCFPDLHFAFLEGGVGWPACSTLTYRPLRSATAAIHTTHPSKRDRGGLAGAGAEVRPARCHLSGAPRDVLMGTRTPRGRLVETVTTTSAHDRRSRSPGPLRAALLLRLRGRRSRRILVVNTTANPIARPPQRDLRSDIGHFDVPAMT